MDSNTDKEWREQTALLLTGPCTCHEAYAGRRLVDPQCQYHFDDGDIAQALHQAMQRRAERDMEIANKKKNNQKVLSVKYANNGLVTLADIERGKMYGSKAIANAIKADMEGEG